MLSPRAKTAEIIHVLLTLRVRQSRHAERDEYEKEAAPEAEVRAEQRTLGDRSRLLQFVLRLLTLKAKS
jgi:hypothetical protein